ncbi:hypothetical protein WH96_20205 [Kiloniella spongiae]|uniref:Glycosyl transferase family 1 domain-containing protein n=1 Tax=Kiloniella spongiae TaxID=1489064 RepID=A0A0H2MQK6_9PROT|nr:glycosyltransferase [Kiloniella spongiae]KLN58950.1 hypothetical protein WH96_20205 [Kiloniella spongiae]
MKVFFTAGDQINWAVDEDLSHTRRALENFVEFTDLASADVVFASWWAPLLDIEASELDGKRVVCFMHGEPARFLSAPNHRLSFEKVDLWITRSVQATKALKDLGYNAKHVPYLANTSKFERLPLESPLLQSMAKRLAVKPGEYLIGNFMRDTEGGDLKFPKLVKGPDLFAEIMREACRRNLTVKAILAGPRRHWLRKHLTEIGVPFEYIGNSVEQDDVAINTLSRNEINALYNLIDLTVVSSRSEGGPLAICEAPMANCKIISTPVGMAPDALPDRSIFRTASEAVDIIQSDIQSGNLESALTETLETLREKNSMEVIRSSLLEALANVMYKPVIRSGACSPSLPRNNLFIRSIRRAKRGVSGRFFRKKIVKIHFSKSSCAAYPYRLLAKILTNESNIKETGFLGESDIIFLNCATDWPLFGEIRINAGLIILLDEPSDSMEFQRLLDLLPDVFLHPSFAATVLSSKSLLHRFHEAGLNIKKPVVIPPLIDASLFNESMISGEENSRSIVLLGPSLIASDFVKDTKDILSQGVEILTIAAASEPNTIWGRTLRVNTLRRCILYIEADTNSSSLRRIREAQACDVPVVYREQDDAAKIVGFGGEAYTDIVSMRSAITSVLENLKSYQALTVSEFDDYKAWVEMIVSIVTRNK